MDNNLEFEKKLLKGKIAEFIFEMMFRKAGYTVIRNGYEYTQPLIAQHSNLLKEKGVIDSLKNTPDFILISHDNTQVYTVEVKYRKTIIHNELKETAEKMIKNWDPSHMFIATPENFYYEPCHTIIKNEGAINRLEESIIPITTQQIYLDLLNEFLSNEKTEDS